MSLWRSTMSNGLIIDKDAIALLVLIGNCVIAAIFWKTSIQKIVIVIEELGHFVLLEKSNILDVLHLLDAWEHFNYCPCHSQVEPHRLAARNQVLVHNRVK